MFVILTSIDFFHILDHNFLVQNFVKIPNINIPDENSFFGIGQFYYFGIVALDIMVFRLRESSYTSSKV